jgi:bifunctional DNA-binding transcriptional regulator/antitoxin component of YhaV-PrlF toxin-antitoxin module
LTESFITKIQVGNRVVIPKKVYDFLGLQKGQVVKVTVEVPIE